MTQKQGFGLRSDVSGKGFAGADPAQIAAVLLGVAALALMSVISRELERRAGDDARAAIQAEANRTEAAGLKAEKFYGRNRSDSTFEVGGPTGAEAIESWSFADGVPLDWTTYVPVERENGALGLTTKKNGEYTLLSRRLKFPVGEMNLRADLQVLVGGLSMAVLDIRRQKLIAESHYSALDTDAEPFGASLAFDAPPGEGPMAIVLSNWAPKGLASDWLLSEIEVRSRETR